MFDKLRIVLLFLGSITTTFTMNDTDNSTSIVDFNLPEYCLGSVPEMMPIYISLLVLISLFLTVCVFCVLGSIKCTRSHYDGEDNVSMSDYDHNTESL